MPNPSLLEQFCSDGQKDAVSTILQTAGWSPENPNINGYQLNTIFNEIYTYLNYLKNKGLSFWEDTKTYKATAGDIDIVRYANKIYFAKQDSNLDGLTPKTPDTNPTYWGVLYDLDKPLETTYALLGGDNTQIFKVADATNDDEAISKGQANISYLGKTAKAVDSDKLDGIDIAQLLRSDIDDTKVGRLYFEDNSTFIRRGSSGQLILGGASLIQEDSGSYFNVVTDRGKNLAVNGYAKLSNGLMIQWGEFVDTDAPVFPVAFPNTALNVQVSWKGDPGNAYSQHLGATNLSATSFDTTNNSTPKQYIAIGY